MLADSSVDNNAADQIEIHKQDDKRNAYCSFPVVQLEYNRVISCFTSIAISVLLSL